MKEINYRDNMRFRLYYNKTSISNPSIQTYYYNNIIHIKSENIDYEIFFVHAPNSNSKGVIKLDFFIELLSLLQKNYENQIDTVLMGTFNTVREKVNSIDTTEKINKFKCREEFCKIEDSYGMVDCFRLRNPNSRVFSHAIRNKYAKNLFRTDHMFVSNKLVEQVEDCSYVYEADGEVLFTPTIPTTGLSVHAGMLLMLNDKLM